MQSVSPKPGHEPQRGRGWKQVGKQSLSGTQKSVRGTGVQRCSVGLRTKQRRKCFLLNSLVSPFGASKMNT